MKLSAPQNLDGIPLDSKNQMFRYLFWNILSINFSLLSKPFVQLSLKTFCPLKLSASCSAKNVPSLGLAQPPVIKAAEGSSDPIQE
jgi:hypothetical protein